VKLPADILERFRRHGRTGGRRRAARMTPEARRAVARRAAAARWIVKRFGAKRFADLGLPGGDLVDRGLADLADGRTTEESLLVSIAAPRLRREGVPVSTTDDEAEDRLYELISNEAGELAHARYGALLRQMVSFADACRSARVDRNRRAT